MDNDRITNSQHHHQSKIAFGVIGLIVVAIMLFLVLNRGKELSNEQINTATPDPLQNQINDEPSENGLDSMTTSTVSWSFDGSKWSTNGTPPACPNPLQIETPTDISLATNILYPGQTRSGDFKPHGGFRFDENTANMVVVKAPMDSTTYRGSRYIEDGEVQYLIDFTAPCGIMFRFDHLAKLEPKFQMLFDKLPEALPDDSRTHNFEDQVTVEPGEIIATEVGFKNTSNVSFDFGVYDLRQPNEISQDQSWASQYQNRAETAFYGVCWLDLLTALDNEKALSLPGGGSEGTTSVYCR